MREERRLGWVSLSVSCHKTQTNKQPNQLAQIYTTSHQNSDLTLRLHNLQTAQFTEKLNGPLRFFAKDHRSYLRALPDTVQDLRAQRKPSFSSLPHDPACTCTGTHWFTSNGDDRRPCPHQVVNVVHNVLVLPLLLSLTRRSQGVVRSRTERENLTGQLIPRSSQGLVPCGRQIVAAVYLASARLRSFRHSCSDRPLSLPAALVIALLYPAKPSEKCVQSRAEPPAELAWLCQ